MNILFYVAIIVLIGIFTAKILSKFNLPNVTGYIIAGLIIGPSVLGIIPKDVANNLDIVSEVALAFIAYSIGSEFNLMELRKMSKGIVAITLFEALTALLFVMMGMLFIFKQPLPFSLVLGAISCATAPASTIMVIKQYKAKGDVVNTLLPVVAMDDAVCIIAFGISSSIAKALMSNAGGISLYSMLISPLIEVVLSLALGFAMGILLILIIKRIKGENELLTVIIGVIFVTAAICIEFNLSSLLACMMIGATVVNIMPNFKKAFTIVDGFTPPIYVAFFTISGIELNIAILKAVGIIGIGYVLLRVIGKEIGAYTGASIAKAPANVKKYLGFTLVPQAGVAIGLSMIGQSILPEPYGAQVRAIVLAATVVYELLGPSFTRKALIKAGEIKVG